VPGGGFPMGRRASGADACPGGMSCGGNELPEHGATVAAFYLDEFEVTVGRFRRFVLQYDGTPPAVGAGAHSLIAATGWKKAWNGELPASQAELVTRLKCLGIGGSALNQTWTDTPGANEQHPINCVTWYQATAFCAWDGGRLPTEAEWEYATAGGDENRLYAWGAAEPTAKLAVFEGINILAVGSKPGGAGRWAHKDLAGNISEWTFDLYSSDWYNEAGSVCTNCANVDDGTSRVLRGGDYGDAPTDLRAASRVASSAGADGRSQGFGFRCARNP
jgi:formylglycine-generating enzyme